MSAVSPPGAGLLYTGIKSYVLNMSQSLDMELKPHGIHVTALCPGFTCSEFHDVMGTRREGWDAARAGKPVCITGVVNKVSAAAMRPIPGRIGYVLGRTLNPFE